MAKSLVSLNSMADCSGARCLPETDKNTEIKMGETLSVLQDIHMFLHPFIQQPQTAYIITSCK